MRLMITLLGTLFAATSFAAQDEYSGIDLAQGNALQMNLCALRPGKTMANYDRVMDGYIQWSKDNDVELFVIRATPIMLGGGADAQFDFIDMLIGPYPVAGNGWDKWLNTESGQKLNAQWQEVGDCTVAVNAAFIQVIDQEALAATDRRIMTFDWCTRKEGVSYDQLGAKHQQMASGWSTDSPIKAWVVSYPSLGSRNTPGEYAHILSFEDANGLMAWQNAQANNEGWRMRADYEASYADCIGENVYSGEVLNRPGS